MVAFGPKQEAPEKAPPPRQPLKEVAGRISNLSYRDMQKLAAAIWSDYAGVTWSGPADVAAGLLNIAEVILEEP
jgi:hypothetical protein